MQTERDVVASALPAYRIGKTVSRDEREVVWSARHRGLDRPVLIRQIFFESDERADQVVLVSRIRALAALNHPHVATTYDYVETESGALVITEQLEGPDLTGIQGLDQRQTCAVGLALVAALDDAHERGIVHGRISATAVRISSDAVPKLTGFDVLVPTTDAGEDVRRCAAMLAELLVRADPLPDSLRVLGPGSRHVRTAREFGSVIEHAASETWGPEWTVGAGIALRGVDGFLSQALRVGGLGVSRKPRRPSARMVLTVVTLATAIAGIGFVAGRSSDDGARSTPGLVVSPRTVTAGETIRVDPSTPCPALPAGWREPRAALFLFDPRADEGIASAATDVPVKEDGSWKGSLVIPENAIGPRFVRVQCRAVASAGQLLPYHDYPPSPRLTIRPGS